MFLPPPPRVVPPPIAAPSPSPLEATALAFCRTLAARSPLESGLDPARLGILRKQAEALEAVCRGTLAGEGRIPPLVQAALGALETATGSGEVGERRFGAAALILARRWRSTQGNLQTDPAGSLRALEDLELLYGFAGLRAVPYRLQALHLRVDRREADPLLEKDLKAAVEDHYGPFLTPVEMEPLLETSQMLVEVWMRRRDDAVLTRRVRELGLVSQASRVWRVVAKGASASLRLDLAALVGRLQPRVLLAPGPEMEDVVLEWAEALLDTPLEGPLREFLQRLDRVLAEDLPARPALRRRIARDRGDLPAQMALLREELAGTQDSGGILRLLEEAVPLLESQRDDALLEAGTRKLKAILGSPVSPPQAQALEAWARLQAKAGHGAEADDLLRPLFGEGETDRGAWYARQGRWGDLEQFLGAPDPGEPDGTRELRLQAEAGRRREDEAARASRATEGEAALKERLANPPEPRKAALEALCRDAEARLGPDHPLVAEILTAWGSLEEEDGIAHVERAIAILEKAPAGREEALFRAHVALAGCCALDPPRVDRCQMALLQFLEGSPSLGPEAAGQAKDIPLILGIRLWREERLDEILSLFPRFLALLKHYEGQEGDSPVGGEDKVGQILTLLERAARLQGRIRAAGLL